MKTWVVIIAVAFALTGFAGEVQVFNNSSSSVVAGVDSVAVSVASGSNVTLAVVTNGTFFISGVLSNAVTSDKNWLSWVATDGSATLSETPELGPGLWAYFAGGIGVGLMFYGFGWQLRLVRAIGSARDV